MKFIVKPARRGLLKRNQWRVVLVADNGASLLSSETYNNIGDAEDMVALVQRGAARAEVETP